MEKTAREIELEIHLERLLHEFNEVYKRASGLDAQDNKVFYNAYKALNQYNENPRH